MSDDEDYSPDGGNSSPSLEDEDEYQPKKTRRRSSSRIRKLSSDKLQTETIAPRRSRRNSNKPPEPMNVDSESEDIAHTQPIATNSNSKKLNLESSDDDSEEIVIISPKPKKKGRKRKADVIKTEDECPPSKKRKTANTNRNTIGSPKKKENKNKASKPKKVLLKGDEATEKLREFMMAQNRPHSKNSAHSELLGAISTGQIQKSMDALTESGVLAMREFGNKSKTKIYWANQDLFEEENEENEDENDVLLRIKALEMQIKQKKETLDVIKKEVIQLKKQPTDQDLELEMKKTVILYERSKVRLNELRANQNESLLVSQDELDEKLVEFYKYGKAWKERKAVVMDMISQIFQESNDKPDKILTKRLNGETDKENDVNWEDYKEMYKTSARLIQQRKDNARRR